VISVAEAERDPARAVRATVPAGCSPVRVVVSADGRTVWVTARESDDLLAFSAGSLLNDPSHALLAVVPVGEAPVGWPWSTATGGWSSPTRTGSPHPVRARR
jgi:DNA-binding beta-propeller fold protein YncE